MKDVYYMADFHILNLKNVRKAAISIAVPLLVGALSAWISGSGGDLFDSLTKPALSPPAWIFPVVWTILYTLMGISAYIVSNSYKIADKSAIDSAMIWYYIQLGLNFFWSIFFFRFELFGFSFFWLLLLFVAVIITTIKFYDINTVAGWLMIPYIAWLSFAAYLNYMIWMLN